MSAAPHSGRPSDEEFKVQEHWHEGQYWFKGDDVTCALGYAGASSQKMLAYHVPEQYKYARDDGVFSFVKNKPVYLNEQGVTLLVAKRTGVGKEAFETWFDNKAGQLRGGSSLRMRNRHQIQIVNETDLHYKVVDYLRRFYPQTFLCPGLGETQDTEAKRIDAWGKGYTAGQCDLLILNSNKTYKGFGIELKRPLGTGELRENQQRWLDRLQKEGYKTMVSGDYDEVCRALMKFFEDK